MSLDINILHNLDKIPEMLDEFKTKQVVNAARRAINRSLTGGRKESTDRLSQILRMKKGKIKKENIRISKAKGGSLGTLEGVLSYNTKGLEMLEFVVGSKQPRSQKGIPVRRRRKIKVEVTRGNRRTMPKVFIAKTTGKNRVFRRNPGEKRLYRQHVPSISHFFDTKGNIKNRTLIHMRRRFEQEFTRELVVRINRLSHKFSDRA